MRSLAILVLAAAIGGSLAGSAAAAESGQPERGRAAYQYWCATCHAAGQWEGRQLPGTISLQLKYNGSRPAALEERTDLTPEYVSYVIRHGSGGMPFFRKTEISDRDMGDIAAYLARNTK
jgi:mono/diheme cytochrome c family protein